MGKIKDWIFAPEEDEVEDEELHEEIDVDPKTSMFEKAHSARTTDAVRKLQLLIYIVYKKNNQNVLLTF